MTTHNLFNASLVRLLPSLVLLDLPVLVLRHVFLLVLNLVTLSLDLSVTGLVNKKTKSFTMMWLYSNTTHISIYGIFAMRSLTHIVSVNQFTPFPLFEKSFGLGFKHSKTLLYVIYIMAIYILSRGTLDYGIFKQLYNAPGVCCSRPSKHRSGH